jgi:uncharacterized membrane protein
MTDIVTKSTGKTQTQTSSHAFRRAVVRGLAVLCPPLLTVLIFVWAINTTKSYFLEPVTSWARDGLVLYLGDVRQDLPLQGPALRTAVADGQVYYRLDGGAFIPQYVYERVQKQPGEPPPTSGDGYYRRYVDLTYLRPYYTTPFFLAVFVLLLYLLGRFMAAGIGGFFGDRFDKLVNRVPGVRSVYSAVKQVSDFVFTGRDIQFTRIVAVEYPRKGIWSMGFVTSEGLAAIQEAAGEPVLAVLVPGSPMPVTGCTITVRKSECIDLNITFDQACQFIVSCGVVVPPQQLGQMRIADHRRLESPPTA